MVRIPFMDIVRKQRKRCATHYLAAFAGNVYKGRIRECTYLRSEWKEVEPTECAIKRIDLTGGSRAAEAEAKMAKTLGDGHDNIVKCEKDLVQEWEHNGTRYQLIPYEWCTWGLHELLPNLPTDIEGDDEEEGDEVRNGNSFHDFLLIAR